MGKRVRAITSPSLGAAIKSSTVARGASWYGGRSDRNVKIYSVKTSERKNAKSVWRARPDDSGRVLLGLTNKTFKTSDAAVKAAKKLGYKNIKVGK